MVLGLFVGTQVLPFASFGISLSSLLFVPIFFYTLGLRHGRGIVRFDIPETALLGFLAVALASISHAHSPATGYLNFVRYAVWVTIAVSATTFMGNEAVDHRCRVVAAGSVAIMGGLLLVDVALFGPIHGMLRFVPYSRNGVAIVFSSFYPLLLHRVAAGERRSGRWLVALGVAILAIVVLNSRGSWMACAVTTTIFLLLHVRPSSLMRTAIGIALVATVLALAPGLLESVTRRAESFRTLDEEFGIQLRVVQRARAMAMFRRSPWIGIGIGNFVGTKAEWDASLINKPVNLERRSAHGTYHQLLAETGILGTGSLALFVLVALVRGVRLPRPARRLFLASPWLHALIGCAIHLSVLSGLTTTATWFLMGATHAQVALARQRARRLAAAR